MLTRLRTGLLAAALVGAALPACAAALDPLALARFDVGYERCEQLDPQMRGQRDAAWLALWRMRADAANAERLATLRRSAAYRKEQQRFRRESAGPAAKAASSPVAQQCEALWAQKTKADARQAAAARPASAP